MGLSTSLFEALHLLSKSLIEALPTEERLVLTFGEQTFYEKDTIKFIICLARLGYIQIAPPPSSASNPHQPTSYCDLINKIHECLATGKKSIGLISNHQTLGNKLERMMAGHVDQDIFFSLLGADKVISADVSSYEGADFVIDLNKATNPALQQKFPIVFDGGTLEHCFNVQSALINACQLVKPGGLIIHCNPCWGAPGHGFYQMSPEFYWQYYTSNLWTLHSLRCLVTFPSLRDVPYFLTGEINPIHNLGDFVQGCAPHGSVGNIICIAQRNHCSTTTVTPVQGLYKFNE